MKEFSFFKKSNGKIIVDSYSVELLIPNNYFENKIAEFISDKLSTMGIFYFRVKTTEKSPAVLYLLNLPNPILISYEKEYKSKEVINNVEDSYRVFVLLKGDTFMESETIVMSSKNVENFVKLLHSGKLPKITYEAIYQQYIQVQNNNNTSLNVPSSVLEAIISELTRSESDVNLPFRLSSEKEISANKFKSINLKFLPNLISTFSCVSFENINSALASGIKRKRLNEENFVSPMEESIKY